MASAQDMKGEGFINLFASSGGFSLGMEQVGFAFVFANEIWAPTAETYRRNKKPSELGVFGFGITNSDIINLISGGGFSS